jgi:uncharacterized membrane protein
VSLPQLIDRQMGVLDPENSHVRVFFPEDEGRMRQLFATVERAFSTGSSRQAYDDLRSARVTHVLAGSLERKRYGDLRHFDDPTWFELVYRDEHACVYRLRASPVLASQPQAGETTADSP